MTTIGYDSIENILLSISDPNTGGAMTQVPGVSSPKINGATSVYNVEGGTGIAGWSTNISWSASDKNTVAWTSGSIYLPDGTAYTISSGGNTGDMTTTTYIYYDMENEAIATTTSASVSVGKDKLLLCVANPVSTNGKSAEFQAFGTNDQSTFIYASNIAANTITGNEIAANTIKAAQIDSGAITTDKIAVGAVTADEIEDGAVVADKIEAGAVTASKINVYQLSSITANLGDVNVGSNSDSKIRIYPNGQQGRIDFSYSGSTVGYMVGQSVSGPGDTLGIVGGSSGNGNIALSGKVWCLGKLRIPVGSNLYG